MRAVADFKFVGAIVSVGGHECENKSLAHPSIFARRREIRDRNGQGRLRRRRGYITHTSLWQIASQFRRLTCSIRHSFYGLAFATPARNLQFVRALLFILILSPLLCFAQTPKSALAFQRIENCTWKPDRWNDGDSFHVITGDAKTGDCCAPLLCRYPGSRDRIDEQAAYFGITREQFVDLGHIASAFPEKQLSAGLGLSIMSPVYP